MIKVSPPTVKVDDFYDLLINNIIKKKNGIALKQEYQNLKTKIIQAEEKYFSYASTQKLNQMVVNDNLPHVLENSDMVFLYTKFVREQKEFYEEIMGGVFGKRCPYCEKRDVSQLDHYLSKTENNFYTVTPYNLIPSCSECNKDKGVAKDLVHPYFDDTTTEEWLKCQIVVSNNSLGVIYSTNFTNCKTISQNLKNRIENTVKRLNLIECYTGWVSNIISSSLRMWKRVYNEQSLEELIKMLKWSMEALQTELDSTNSYYRIFLKSLINYLKNDCSDLCFLQNDQMFSHSIEENTLLA